jgi:hypothetical protein
MSRLPLKPTVIKRLFAVSKNECAYPSCKNAIVDELGTVIGEICHIEAAEEGGERYNADSNDEYRRSFDNLILMCSNHHKRTNNVIEYTTGKLKILKEEHESGDYSISDNIVEQANKKYMEQNNTNGSGTQFNNQARTQNIGTQIGSQIIHNYSFESDKPFIDGARKVNNTLKILISNNIKAGSQPEKTVIDFKNELQDKTVRDIVTIDTKFLKFRKENGRIKADVESYEKTNVVTIDECDDSTQSLLKDFLIKNDPEKNDELKRSLIQKGQREPAIITCDGFLINGNRRKMALEELFVERNQDPRFQMMRVVILDDGSTELDIQKLENRLQLQSEGKSEYQGLNRALTIRANEKKGFTLEAQLKDDPNYHDLGVREFNKIVADFRKKYLHPLECVDRYLATFDRVGMYNTISEGANDKEGRWQAFIDYSSFVSGTLQNKSKMNDLKIKENEVGNIENAVFKIIRKRSLSVKGTDIGKVHDFVRKLPKYLGNEEAKKLILDVKNVPEDISEQLKYDKDGTKLSERDIDEKWGADNREQILGNLIQAYRHVHNQQERDKPLELLEDALKKLQHDNLKIDNMGTDYYEKALELTKKIIEKAENIHKEVDGARYKFKNLGKIKK